jgi:hypothetical protein
MRSGSNPARPSRPGIAAPNRRPARPGTPHFPPTWRRRTDRAAAGPPAPRPPRRAQRPRQRQGSAPMRARPASGWCPPLRRSRPLAAPAAARAAPGKTRVQAGSAEIWPSWVTRARKAVAKPWSIGGCGIVGALVSNTSASSSVRDAQWRYSVDLATPERSATASTVTLCAPDSTSRSSAAASSLARLRRTRGSTLDVAGVTHRRKHFAPQPSRSARQTLRYGLVSFLGRSVESSLDSPAPKVLTS